MIIFRNGYVVLISSYFIAECLVLCCWFFSREDIFGNMAFYFFERSVLISNICVIDTCTRAL